MLEKLIQEDLIRLDVEATNWEEAIRMSAEPLLQTNKVTVEYIDKIIENSKTIGPYFVLAKHIALPHASFQCGALEKAIGICRLKTPIASGMAENDPVKYLFCLSATDNNSHLEALSQLVQLLDDESFFMMLDNATAPAEVMQYISEKTYD